MIRAVCAGKEEEKVSDFQLCGCAPAITFRDRSGAFRLPFPIVGPTLKIHFMASSRKWATAISFSASCIYFLVIIIQIPLFRVPCRSGTCTTPIGVTAPQLMACDMFPLVAIKALLYPGAVANALVKNEAIPSYNNLKLHDPSAVKAADAMADLQRLEVLVGSYISVAGAFLGLIKPGRMSFYGVLLILWGLVKEIMLRKSASSSLIYIYPAMSIAVCSAFLSIAKDVRRIIRSCRGLQIVKAKRL